MLGAVKQAFWVSARVGSNVAAPGVVVMIPVLGSKLTARFLVLIMSGITLVGTLVSPGSWKGFRPTIEPEYLLPSLEERTLKVNKGSVCPTPVLSPLFRSA